MYCGYQHRVHRQQFSKLLSYGDVPCKAMLCLWDRHRLTRGQQQKCFELQSRQCMMIASIQCTNVGTSVKLCSKKCCVTSAPLFVLGHRV